MSTGREADPADQTSGRKKSFSRFRDRLDSAKFLIPAMGLVGLLLIAPFLWTVMLSFTEYGGLGSATFVGLDNYTRLFGDPILLRSLANTVLWVVGSLTLPVGIGLFVAVLTFNLSGGFFYRLPILMPYALSGAAVGVLWSFMLQSDGAANGILTAFGLEVLTQDWLLSAPLNTISMILASTWQATGVSLILFLVGLQAIPPEPIEAARVDGAHGWTLFWNITLPLLRPMTVVVIGISLINSLKVFDIIWVITQGGPSRSSETLAVTMYRQTFLLFEYGYGSTVAVALSFIVVALSWFYLRRALRPE